MAASSSVTARFHLVISSILLTVVFLGFYKTFFLRPWFETYDVQPYVLLHGVPMTLWFVWYAVQSWLIGARKPLLHRRLGLIGIGIGTLAAASAAFVNFAMLIRAKKAGRDIEAEISHYSDVVWSNLAPLLVYIGFFSVAVVFRKRTGIHSRSMMLASIAMVDPALARIGLLPAVSFFGYDLNYLVFPVGLMALLALSLPVHDLISAGRLHWATSMGVPILWFGIPLIRSLAPESWIGQTVIRLFA